MKDSPQLIFSELMKADRENRTRKALAALFGDVPQFNLACLGISMAGLGAMTFEALTYLTAADVVYCYPSSPEILKVVELLNDNVIDMHDTLYARGAPFDETYAKIIDIVGNKVREGGKVAYATQGSPAFHCGTAAALHRRMSKEGYNSLLIPGISSLELLIADLLIDQQLVTFQTVSVSDVIARRYQLNSESPCLLFDLSRHLLPAVRDTSSPLDGHNLEVIMEFIREVYPAEHEVRLMYVRTEGNCISERTTVNLLASAIKNFFVIPTLYFPAAQTPPEVE